MRERVSLRTQPAAIINIASCGGKSYIRPIVELSGGIPWRAAGGCLMVTTRTIRSLAEVESKFHSANELLSVVF